MDGRRRGEAGEAGEGEEGRRECSMSLALSLSLFIDDNIPKNQFHSVFISQLVRFASPSNSISSFNEFIGDCKNLGSKLSRQHFNPVA